MTARAMRLLGFFLGIVLASCAAQAPAPLANDQTESARLIQDLVSKFPPAHEDEYRGKFRRPLKDSPQEKDLPQERDALRVRKAYERLRSMGIAAFDDLVAASDDERYSFSAAYAAWENHSVGAACFMIIKSQVDTWGYGYKLRDGANGKRAVKPQYLWHVRETEGLTRWWKQRRGAELRELQIESLRWTIAREEAIGFTSEAQRQLVVGPLEKRLNEIGGPASP